MGGQLEKEEEEDEDEKEDKGRHEEDAILPKVEWN